MTNRVHIDAPAGVVEIEGEKEFVEGLLAKVFPLLEAAGFGSRPPNDSGATFDQPNDSPPADQPPADQNGKTKTRRRRVSTPPKGQSCADRITTLKDAGFFKSHRSVADIVEGLKGKGWTHASNQVGASLSDMFNRNAIQRTKEGKGAWKYFWDRD